MTTEIWKKMDEPHTRYSISNQGEIRDDLKMVLRKKYPTGGNENRRYFTVNIRNDWTKKYGFISLHQTVARYFLPPPADEGYVINHINNDTTDNRAENLEWIAHRENTRRRRSGHIYGMKAVTTPKYLQLVIYHLGQKGAHIPDIAEAFGLKYFSVYRLINHNDINRDLYENFVIMGKHRFAEDTILPYVKNLNTYQNYLAQFL